MGSISPDSAGAKRSRLKVGPQLRFRVCDSLLLLSWQVSFWSASHQRAACTQKYRYRRYSRVGVQCFSSKNASGGPVVKHYCILSDRVRCTGDKNEKDDFGDDDKCNPTKLCLASASLHQHHSPAAVLPSLWRKQQIRDKGKREMGDVFWQSSYYCGFPDVHMKEQCWLLCPGQLEPVSSVAKGLTLMFFMVQCILEDIQICVLISSTSEQVSFFIKRYFISEDCTLQWSKVFYLSSTLATHPTIQPSNQTSMSSSQARSSVSTAAQLGRSIKVGGSQSNLCNQRNAALKTTWHSQWVAKNHLGKAQSQVWGKNDELMICSLTSPNSITFEVSKWRWWKSVHPSVLSPCRSSPALNTTS